MNLPSAAPPRRRRAPRATAFAAAATLSALAAGCATPAPDPATARDARAPTQAELVRVANASLSSGNASVRFVDGVAYVSGNVATTLEERRIVRDLGRVPGVERVGSRLDRGMRRARPDGRAGAASR